MHRLAALVFLAAAASSGAARADVDPALAALTAGLPMCEAGRAHCFGIQLHVTVGDAGPIAGAEFLAGQLAAANRHFAALDVGFQVVGIDALPPAADHVATRRERDELSAGRLVGRVIHVFIVGQLDDVDDPGGIIRGVTWHTHGDARKYVLVSTVAPERVLAHELGHFFGLPHSTYAISIMNKTERAAPPVEQRTFADEEVAAMRQAVARLLRAKVIAEIAN